MVMMFVSSSSMLACDGQGDCTSANPCEVTIDYADNLAQMLRKVHKVDWIDPDLSDQSVYPIDGHGIATYQLEFVELTGGDPVLGEKRLTTENALTEIYARGLEPARIEHLLALGAVDLGILWEKPVVAIGSIDEPTTMWTPCSDVIQRGTKQQFTALLKVYYNSGAWDGTIRFLAVRP